MRFLARLLAPLVLILPAFVVPTLSMRPSHPVSGYRCWTEINTAMPDGSERICQATS